MEEKDSLINLILGKEECLGRKSTLQMALSVARHLYRYYFNPSHAASIYLSGSREGSEGTHDILFGPTTDEAELFAALLLYLVSLEQIGYMFVEDCTDKDNNGITKALRKYSLLKNKDEEIQAIKNLRNALGHDFGLAALSGKRAKIDYNAKDYKFILEYNSDKKGIIVELPNKDWGDKKHDKNWNDRNEETSTIIYPINLINMIEKDIIEKIQSADTISFREGLSIEEVKTRFTILS